MHGLADNFDKVVDRKDGQFLQNLLWNLLQILHIILRDEDALDAGPLGGHQLLGEPSDGHDVAPERDFACHGQLRVHGYVEDERKQGCEERCARRGTVLGCGPLGNMDVEIHIPEIHIFFLYAEAYKA